MAIECGQPSMVASTDTKSTTTLRNAGAAQREERGLADPKLVRTLARAYLIQGNRALTIGFNCCMGNPRGKVSS